MICNDYDIDDLRYEAIAERQKQLSATQCQCHFEMPGTCPGPHNCPMCQTDDEGDEE